MAQSHCPRDAVVRMTSSVTPRSILALVCAAAIVAACQAPPKAAAPSEQVPRGAQPATAAPAPAATAPAPPPPPPPPAPLTEAEIRQLLESARNLLDQGQEDAAAADLDKILESEPNQKSASTLMRSIREDPVVLYGRESFHYRVGAGDTLAGIASRYLNDRDQFYGLARYNGIKVPRQLPAGITIRIPGKQRAPTPAAAPPPAPTPAAAPPAAPAPPPAPSPAPAPTATPAPPPTPAAPPPPPPPDPEVQRKAQIERLSRQARALMARQDVCGAIGAWDAVLKIDPDNRTATLEREKALDLKKRLPGAKC